MDDDRAVMVLVCGGRDFADADALGRALSRANPLWLVHGGAPGADTLAGEWADRAGVPTVVVPALWTSRGKAAGPARNVDMLLVAITLADRMYPDELRLGVAAFPGGAGTEDMVRRAERAGVKVWRPLG